MRGADARPVDLQWRFVAAGDVVTQHPALDGDPVDLADQAGAAGLAQSQPQPVGVGGRYQAAQQRRVRQPLLE